MVHGVSFKYMTTVLKKKRWGLLEESEISFSMAVILNGGCYAKMRQKANTTLLHQGKKTGIYLYEPKNGNVLSRQNETKVKKDTPIAMLIAYF